MKVQKIFSYIQRIYGPMIFLLSLATAALNILLLMLINRGLATIGAGYSPAYRIGVGFFICLIAYLSLDYIYQAALIKLSENFTCKVRLELLDQIRKSSYEKYEKIGMDRIWPVLSADPLKIGLLATLTSSFISSAATIVGVLIYIFFLSIQGFLYSMLLLAAYLAISLVAQRRIVRHLKYQNTLEEDLFMHILDLVLGIKEMKVDHDQNDDLYGNYLVPKATRLQDERTENTIFQTRISSFGSSIFLLTIGCFLFLLPVLHWNLLKDPVQFVVAIFFVRGSVLQLVPLFPGFATAVSTIERLEQFKKDLGDNEIRSSGKQEGSFESLRLEEVSFSYPGETGARQFTVGPINLEIRKGDLIFIHGGNGSGKSTLARLLCSLYPARQGTMMLNNTKIGSADLRSYRDLFGVSFTDNYLSAKLYGNTIPVSDEVNFYIEKLGLAQTISFKGNSFSSLNLSEGQKKRVSLIHLLIKDKPIYIFDEWAANQDPEFRDFFYRNIVADLVTNKKTVIVITHDDRYFYLARRLFKMDNGRLFEVEHRFNAVPMDAVPSS